jgi:hypothetical protein
MDKVKAATDTLAMANNLQDDINGLGKLITDMKRCTEIRMAVQGAQYFHVLRFKETKSVSMYPSEPAFISAQDPHMTHYAIAHVELIRQMTAEEDEKREKLFALLNVPQQEEMVQPISYMGPDAN